MREWEKQKSEPLHIQSEDFTHIFSGGSVWAFKDYIYLLEGAEYEPEEAKQLHIKHFVFKREKEFSRMKKEVERFERFEKINPVYREQIPEEVRMYVWRRDNGRCVKCNSDKNLEFDHIIPISKGGSNTERNIQLLCSECNKKKSNII
jgi:5-methylcytosine-specific restriction endonuclease McrA